MAACTGASKEYFYQESAAPAPSVPLTNQTLIDAGLVRPSVFNCADQIGITAEANPLFAFKSDL